MLTASGGPFLNWSAEAVAFATPAQACAHPRWNMGRKISVDSATLMNKGLELIEATVLFGLPAGDVEVVVHPQSIVHSMVEYIDGSVLAQMAAPDMRVPIAQALASPHRMAAGVEFLDLVRAARLDFQAPDVGRFPCLRLAREAAVRGGLYCASLNAADEVAVQAFLDKQLNFGDIPTVIEMVMDRVQGGAMTGLDAVLAADSEARALARLGDRAACRRTKRAGMSLSFPIHLLAFVAAISLLVTVHEFGHYWVARRLGFKVLRFSVGFGKALWTRVAGADRTEYVIAAVPLGGYVKMLDEREGPVAAADLPRSFTRRPHWQRITVLLAGPAFNIMFAIVLLTAVYLISGINEVRPVLGSIEPNTLLGRAGFKANDEIVAIDSRAVNSQEDILLQLLDAVSGSAPITVSARVATAQCEPRRWIFPPARRGCT